MLDRHYKIKLLYHYLEIRVEGITTTTIKIARHDDGRVLISPEVIGGFDVVFIAEEVVNFLVSLANEMNPAFCTIVESEYSPDFCARNK